jgi:predicted Fe-Mo cluster-binding NifX family protein
MKIAIPELDDKIAPCFEAAKQFEIFTIKKGKIISSKTIDCHATDDIMRIRLLRLHEIQTLICNGIKNFFRDQLLAYGINVIPNINESIKKSLSLFLSGQLLPHNNMKVKSGNDVISHDDLVKWAKELFESNGYEVSTCPGEESFLIDLIAGLKCPLCKKNIEVAICCGAQTYRADQEIREFHHYARTRYNAFAYVYLTNTQLEKSCIEYGINFLSPGVTELDTKEKLKSRIPILKIPIEGHEKAFSYAK